jgi:hypothetical protein
MATARQDDGWICRDGRFEHDRTVGYRTDLCDRQHRVQLLCDSKKIVHVTQVGWQSNLFGPKGEYLVPLSASVPDRTLTSSDLGIELNVEFPVTHAEELIVGRHARRGLYRFAEADVPGIQRIDGPLAYPVFELFALNDEMGKRADARDDSYVCVCQKPYPSC